MASQKFIFRTQLTDVSYQDLEGVGQLRYEDDKVYRWVKNPVTNYTPAAGDLICHVIANTTTAFQNLSKPLTANLMCLGGVVMAPMDANTGTNPKVYGWIQVLGMSSTCKILPTNTVTTAGPAAGATIKAVDANVYGTLDQAAGTAPIYTRTILNLAAVAAGTEAVASPVYIKCL